MKKINLNTLPVGIEYWSMGYDMNCEVITIKVKYLGKKNGKHIIESGGVRIINPTDYDYYSKLLEK